MVTDSPQSHEQPTSAHRKSRPTTVYAVPQRRIQVNLLISLVATILSIAVFLLDLAWDQQLWLAAAAFLVILLGGAYTILSAYALLFGERATPPIG